MKLFLTVLFLLGIGLCQGKTKVYFFAGQSNAVGWFPESVPFIPDPVDQQVRFFYDISTSKNLAGTTLERQGTRFGAEFGIGRTLHGQGVDDIVIVKVGHGGQSLYQDFSPEIPGVWFTRLMDAKETVLAKLAEEGEFEVCGFFWMQGEADAGEGQSGNYEANLKNFITQVRTAFNDFELPFLAGHIKHPNPNSKPYLAINAAIDAIALEDSAVYSIETADLPLLEGVHFTGDSLIEMGNRMAKTLLTHYQKSNLWAALSETESGWIESDWMGWLNTKHSPWIYHTDHEWLYTSSDSSESVWMWSEQFGWCWCNSCYYPWIWVNDMDTWVYYLVGAQNSRWFYNSSNKAWEAR